MKHGRDWRGGGAVAERSGVMEAGAGTLESPSKMASLPFLMTGFLAKTRESLCKDLTRPPCRYRFAMKNGKMFFEDADVLHKKVPQEEY
ncbi:MAG: hypothetical protein J6Y30_12300 [Treponema sp.]|nr:hypothetical protein [Treponema sp.]